MNSYGTKFRMNPFVSLAKLVIETLIKEKKIISIPKNLPKEFLERKSGTFVTIEKEGKLRGCIGTYLPTKENIAKEIISNAIAAATKDYRFLPIQKQELPYLSYTVYALNKPELVKDINELDPKKYGIIVKTLIEQGTHAKSGLLLPDLEGIGSVKEQISIACQKAGIDAQRDEIIIYKFTVEKYGQQENS